MNQTDQRADYIRKIRVAPLLDAVFLLFYYNEWSRRRAPPPEHRPTLGWSEALPALSQSTYEHALALVRQMWNDATALSTAALECPQTKGTFREALVAFKEQNPGFGEESYKLAVRAAFLSTG